MSDAIESRFANLEQAQRETNRTLLRIDETLATSSKLFELMHARLEHLEHGQQALVVGQQALVEGQQALVEGQHAVVERLDRLIGATNRERTLYAEMLGRMDARLTGAEGRLDAHDRRLDDLEDD